LAAKGKRGLFDDPHIGSYIERLAEWEARVGTLFFNTLKCGEKEIAYLLGTIWDGSLDTVIWTYDPDYAAESPGTLIVVNSISWAIDHGLKICNFLYTGGQTEKDFKRRFSNISAKTHEYSFSNTMRGRVLEEASYATWAIKRKLDPALAVSR
jgi:CelD/BcsL family acetyltransferase involved in cellulose biosynthesis